MSMPNLAVFGNRDFSLLWWGGLISYLGNWMLTVAVPVTVLEATGSPTAMTAVIAAATGVKLLLGPFVGVLVDRWDRRRVMVGGNLVLAVIVLPYVLVSPSTWWLCAILMAASAAVSPFVSTSEDALLPRVVPDAQLPAANSLNSLNNDLGRLIGPFLGGAAVLLWGLKGVAIADAATYLVAAALIFFVRGKHRAERTAPVPGKGAVARFLGEFGEGVKLTAANPVLRVVFGFFLLTFLGEGVFSSMFIAYTERVLDGGPAEYAWLLAAQAVGGILGGLVGARYAGRWSPRLTMGIGAVVFGLIDLFTFNYPKLWMSVVPGVIAMIVVGVPFTLSYSTAQTLVQRSTEDAYRGRVFAARGTLTAAAMLAGTGMAVLLGHSFDVVTVLNVQGAMPILAGLVTLLFLPSLPAKEKPKEPALAQ
ncbi:MFS transporter [Actinorhabdospora filicis]|uniref:MFS transporter n=1 Tax=Actinorhabdospora filicis TaxID=1785913 RepID=A0A9W6SH62_9ACTN|nr:MFS transporter [Actinorhabdospora filicis]GLZ75897.1 MFS transporter [Actinorhabdospora filicis]